MTPFQKTKTAIIENGGDAATLLERRLADLSGDELRHYARIGLQYEHGAVIRALRNPKRGRSRSSRLEAAVEAREAELSLVWLWIGGETQRPLLDCTLTDLTAAADAYTAEIGALEDRVERCSKIMRAMRKSKVEVAGDLPGDVLQRLWFDA